MEKKSVTRNYPRPPLAVASLYWVILPTLSISTDLGKVVGVDSCTRVLKVHHLLRKNGYEDYQLAEVLLPYDHPDLQWSRMTDALEIVGHIPHEIVNAAMAFSHATNSIVAELSSEVVGTIVHAVSEELMNELYYFTFKSISEEVENNQILEVVTDTLNHAKSEREAFLSEMSQFLDRLVLSEFVSDIATVLLMDYIDTVNIGIELQTLLFGIVEDIKIKPKLSTIVGQSDMTLPCKQNRSTADESAWIDDESTVESSLLLPHVVDEKEEVLLSTIRPHRDEKVTVPPLDSCMKGYYVSYSVDGREINEIFGKVVAIDESKQLICVSISTPSSHSFSPTSPSNHNRIWVSYDHPFLIWYRGNRSFTNSPRVSSALHMAVVRAPISIQKAIGYKVCTKSSATGHVSDTFSSGRVTAIDAASNLLIVSLDGGDKHSGLEKEVTGKFLWRSPSVHWIGLPCPATLAGIRYCLQQFIL